MKDRFESLESGEVISVQQDTPVLSGQRTFRVGELNDAIRKQLESAIEGWSDDKSAWFSPDGIDCEALRFGSNGWQSGRIRLCLEFCPDEPISAEESVSNNSAPTTVSAPLNQVAQINTPSGSGNSNSVLTAVAEPIITTAILTPETPASVPLAGVTVGSVMAGAAVLAAMPQEVASIPTAEPVATTPEEVASIPTAEPVTTAPEEVASVSTPHLTDVVLVSEDELDPLNTHHVEGLDEISFEFHDNGGDRQGTLVSNGMMELDLTDLERSEHDYLNFEIAGMSDPAQSLEDAQDLSQSENSGMLIDEVWNEINQQPSWPGIH